MSKTTFSNKCEILGDLYFWHKDTDNEVWSDFFEWGDVGLPLAYMVKQGYATAKDKGKESIEEAWKMFCEIIEVDSELRYLSLADIFDASENDTLA
jgi:hypothetical protein